MTPKRLKKKKQHSAQQVGVGVGFIDKTHDSWLLGNLLGIRLGGAHHSAQQVRDDFGAQQVQTKFLTRCPTGGGGGWTH